MDFQDLNAFVHVARMGSFSRAAVSLRTAQSALSRRVARLEHGLGVSLLERHGRGVRVTRAGELLLGEADELLEKLMKIERLMGEHSGAPIGLLKMAMPPTTGQVLGAILVAKCRERFPRLQLQLMEGFSGSIHRWIEGGDVDIAILYDPEPSAHFLVTPLLKEPLYLIAPAKPGEEASLLQNKELRVRDLAKLPLILPGRAHSIRALLERYAAEHGFKLNVVNQVDGIRTTTGMIEAGLGYTVYSYAGVYEWLQNGSLRAIPLTPRLRWTLAITHRLDLPPSLLEGIRSMIIEQVDILLERGLWHGERATD
jgi:LysR family nitrogen assimilation transcriptional regulator